MIKWRKGDWLIKRLAGTMFLLYQGNVLVLSRSSFAAAYYELMKRA